MKPAETIAYTDFHEGYLSRYIALADAKAGICFSLNAALLGFLVSRDWLPPLIEEAGTGRWVAWIAIATVLLAAAMAFWVVVPRLRASSEGLIFWQSVRKFPTEADFKRKVANTTITELADARLSHTYALSRVAKSKYFWLVIAAWLTVASVGSTAAATYMFGLKSKEPTPTSVTIFRAS